MVNDPARLLPYFRSAWLPAACTALIGFFGYHAFAGDSGLLALGGYRAEHARLAREMAALARHKAELQHKVALLNPDRVDPDYADELVRKNLGVVRSDEVVIPLARQP